MPPKRAKRERATAVTPSLHAVLSQVAPLLLRYPNVRSVGIGLPVRKGRRSRTPAIIVGVSTKKDMSSQRSLPRELFGVKVDVQRVPRGRLLAGTAPAAQGAMQCRGEGREEFGHLGMLAETSAGRACALTALHVLVDEELGDSVDGGDHRNDVIEIAPFGDEFASGGRLTRGGFSNHADIALIELNKSVATSPSLSGRNLEFEEPIVVTKDDLPARVGLYVPSEFEPILGNLVGINESVSFEVNGVETTFSGLLKFTIDAPSVRAGWCGSVIYAKSTRVPLALLSFGTLQGPAMAWGFPIAPYWHAWNLSRLRNS